MVPEEIEGNPKQKIREQAWAKPVSRLAVSELPSEAVNLNVAGRQLVGPLQGFGQLWQKTYKVRLSGAQASPEDVIQEWKANFPSFWPQGNHFYGPLTGIKAGEVAVLNLAAPGGINVPGGRPAISTGVLVIYADEESFSFMTPQGHMFASMITFSAFDDEGTVAQVQALVRANDPIYEMTFRLGFGHKTEDEFWHQTLKNLAAYFEVEGQVQQNVSLVDPKVQWSQAKNIWHNAAIRTMIYTLLTPLRWIRNSISR